jgi:putative transposase
MPEWAMIEPRLSHRRRLGQPPKTEMRCVVNALLYMVRTGCQWRQLPREFPPYTTVQHYFYAWRDSRVLERINFELLLQACEAAGRHGRICPSCFGICLKRSGAQLTPQ